MLGKEEKEGRRRESQVATYPGLAVSEHPCSLRPIAFCTNGTHLFTQPPGFYSSSAPIAEPFTPPCGYQAPPPLSNFCQSLRCAFPLS
ncbi:uncharacterized protein BO95DRAFT_282567 [Aspergillus brunneoviolaceus CBS 621.78]|uniref:Uncharacterized protein n=1 Tax=Aspergillus brunneoviolaceus CBS 621.78 TaxID=1450534 RepID=A0ACD1FV69_9EURO|nr:hypothetical protein BO95DRAFT_282567 [Aspergillus brunneoviolaceus CBS 621.78]RAH40886.1 hypothetical protein BO95DRAFT_282567 [Aspergillus brunneoviolaceus CBS 621.78]